MMNIRIIAVALWSFTTISAAFAETSCLPKALFPDDVNMSAPSFDLGLAGGAPTLCAQNEADVGGYSGCWTVDAENGSLTASTATSLPGHSQWGKADQQGCVQGYCPEPKPNAGDLALWVTSTDGKHTAVRLVSNLFVFDTASKQQTAAIALWDANAPEGTSVSNEPIDIMFIGDMIYVVGSDAGPYMGVWAFKDDGTRVGGIKEPGSPAEYGPMSVYPGGFNVTGDNEVLIAGPGWQSIVLLGADGSRQFLSREVSTSPCTEEEMSNVNIGDVEQLSDGCKAVVSTRLEPYFELDPVRLPSGDLLAALAHKGRGSMAIVDSRSFEMKRRFELPRCTN